MECCKIPVCWIVGDHDAILVLLLISRLLWKAEILLAQVRDRFLAIEKIDRIAVVRGHAVEQFAFKSRLCYYVYSLQVGVLYLFSPLAGYRCLITTET